MEDDNRRSEEYLAMFYYLLAKSSADYDQIFLEASSGGHLAIVQQLLTYGLVQSQLQTQTLSIDELLTSLPVCQEPDVCAICLDSLEEIIYRILPCGHKYHENCLRDWFKRQRRCPCCRARADLPAARKTVPEPLPVVET